MERGGRGQGAAFEAVVGRVQEGVGHVVAVGFRHVLGDPRPDVLVTQVADKPVAHLQGVLLVDVVDLGPRETRDVRVGVRVQHQVAPGPPGGDIQFPGPCLREDLGFVAALGVLGKVHVIAGLDDVGQGVLLFARAARLLLADHQVHRLTVSGLQVRQDLKVVTHRGGQVLERPVLGQRQAIAHGRARGLHDVGARRMIKPRLRRHDLVDILIERQGGDDAPCVPQPDIIPNHSDISHDSTIFTLPYRLYWGGD